MAPTTLHCLSFTFSFLCNYCTLSVATLPSHLHLGLFTTKVLPKTSSWFDLQTRKWMSEFLLGVGDDLNDFFLFNEGYKIALELGIYFFFLYLFPTFISIRLNISTYTYLLWLWLTNKLIQISFYLTKILIILTLVSNIVYFFLQ